MKIWGCRGYSPLIMPEIIHEFRCGRDKNQTFSGSSTSLFFQFTGWNHRQKAKVPRPPSY